jgi:hypothetical protein
MGRAEKTAAALPLDYKIGGWKNQGGFYYENHSGN